MSEYDVEFFVLWDDKTWSDGHYLRDIPASNPFHAERKAKRMFERDEWPLAGYRSGVAFFPAWVGPSEDTD